MAGVWHYDQEEIFTFPDFNYNQFINSFDIIGAQQFYQITSLRREDLPARIISSTITSRELYLNEILCRWNKNFSTNNDIKYELVFNFRVSINSYYSGASHIERRVPVNIRFLKGV
ncbi:MAG: hypothetical protein JW917_00850 [Ignavibacteria bacterium]|nr:hypothetical protein [Ignavibacteria bacterium]